VAKCISAAIVVNWYLTRGGARICVKDTLETVIASSESEIIHVKEDRDNALPSQLTHFCKRSDTVNGHHDTLHDNNLINPVHPDCRFTAGGIADVRR
jgi:hypothetical protein